MCAYPVAAVRGGLGQRTTNDSDAATLIAAMSPAPDGARQTLINTTVVALKAAGIWALMDECWFMAAHASQSSLLGWKRYKDLSAVNSPTFTTNRGYKSNGTSSYLDTNFAPGTHGVNYTLNDASIGIYCCTELVESKRDINARNSATAGISSVTPRFGSGQSFYAINQGAEATKTIDTCLGLYVSCRRDSVNAELWHEGALIDTEAAASTAVTTANICIACGNVGGVRSNFTNKEYPFVFVGASLSAGQQLALYNIVLQYLNAVYAISLVTTSTPFTSGTGYTIYRIPALARTATGVILAVCEGRPNTGDGGNIDLVLRRSLDDGATWQTQQVLAGGGDANCHGNPVLVVSGSRTYLLYSWRNGADDQSEIMAATGADVMRVYLLYTDDNGATWTAPAEITSSVKGATERWIAIGPGHGIVLQVGGHAGRLIVPINVSDPTAFGSNTITRSSCIYSDDSGVTWQRGGTVPTDNTNECQIFEASDGVLVINMRDQDLGKLRKVAASTDGGATWSSAVQDETLIEPTVQSSIYYFSDNKIVFANPATRAARLNMRLRIGSYATGAAGKVDWDIFTPVYTSFSAYSDLCAIGDDVGIVFEKGVSGLYETIEFRRYDA